MYAGTAARRVPAVVTRKQTTTGKGLGYRHQQDRDRLLRNHRDGAPCPCLDDNRCGPACLCRPGGYGLPMYREPSRNSDGEPLHADHPLARSQGGKRAERLMLATCNKSRGDGTRVWAGATSITRPTWWTRTWWNLPTPPTATSVGGSPRLVVLLCGPPGAGKTTAAHQSGLTVYDRDDPQWTSEKQFTAALANLADDPTARAVVIRSGASSSARAEAAALVGATHTYLLLAEPAELGHRVARRGRADKTATLAAIGQWFDRFDRDDEAPEFPGWPALDLAVMHAGA